VVLYIKMARKSTNWGGAREGAGRPPDYDEPCRKQAYYMPERVIAKLFRLAVNEKITASQKLVQILERLKG